MKLINTGIRISPMIILCGLLLVHAMPTGHASTGSVKDSLVIFPPAIASTIPADKMDVVEQITDDLFLLAIEGLSESDRFSVVKFDVRMASIQRVMQERQLTEKDFAQALDTTYDGSIEARERARAMGAAYALISSVDAYSFREGNGEVELTATMQLIDVRTGNSDTVMATGRSARTVEGGHVEKTLGVAATYDLAEKLVSDIGAVSATELASVQRYTTVVIEEPAPSTSKNRGFIPAVLGAMLLGFLLSGN